MIIPRPPNTIVIPGGLWPGTHSSLSASWVPRQRPRGMTAWGLCLLFVASLCRASVPVMPSSATVSGTQLILQKRLRDGALSQPVPFTIKGVDWSPATRAPDTGPIPPGYPSPSAASNQYGFFFDWTGRNPQGHVVFNYWLSNENLAHYQQDIPLMAAMHINTVRVYNDFGDDPAAYTAILDAFYNNGIMVIMTVVNARTDIDSGHYLDVVRKCQNHPAILMWLLGNEWNLTNPPLFGYTTYLEAAAALNTAAAAIKLQDSNHPVSSSLGDVFTPNGVNDNYLMVSAVPNVDIWNLNIYRGSSFGTLFTQWPLVTTKPFYFGEFGTDAFQTTAYTRPFGDNRAQVQAGFEDQATQSSFDLGLWQEIQNQLSGLDASKPCVGGLIWTWNDHLWKVGDFNVGLGNLVNYNGPDGIAGNADDDRSYASYNPDGFFLPGAHPDNVANEEYFGLVNADRIPRQAYQTLRSFYAGLVPLPMGSLEITPSSATIKDIRSVNLTATALDILEFPLGIQPAFTWSIFPHSGASVSDSGLFTALAASGTYVATVQSGPFSRSIGVTVDLPSLPADFSALRVYPSPWRSDLHRGHDITFDTFTGNATVKIFTLSGHWVQTLGPSGASVTWDLKNSAGDLVASGLYFYVITNDQGQKSRGKFAIIR